MVPTFPLPGSVHAVKRYPPNLMFHLAALLELLLETSILFSGKELLALLTGRPFGGDGSNGLRLTQTQKWDLTREDEKKYESLCFVHLF